MNQYGDPTEARCNGHGDRDVNVCVFFFYLYVYRVDHDPLQLLGAGDN